MLVKENQREAFTGNSKVESIIPYYLLKRTSSMILQYTFLIIKETYLNFIIDIVWSLKNPVYVE